MADNESGGTFIELTAEIVSAYVSNNSVPAGDLSALINQVHSALTRVSSGQHDLPSEPLDFWQRYWLGPPERPLAASEGRFYLQSFEMAAQPWFALMLNSWRVDRWLADNTIYGPPTKVRDSVAAWRAAGVNTPVLVANSIAGNQITALYELLAAFLN